MLAVHVDPGGYQTAAGSVAEANTGVIDAMSALGSTLDGCTSMAGSDSGGTDWAGSYDAGARSCLRAGIDLGNNLGDMATLLTATGDNHARADAASTAGGAPGATRAVPSTESLYAPDPPSASGGGGDGEPAGWTLIAHLLAYTWPNGDQGRLRQAGTAWTTAAAALTAGTSPLASASSLVGEQQSPEVTAAQQALADAATDLTDLATSFTALGGACADYATYLDHAHQQVVDELVSLVEWAAALEVAGGLLSLVTFGGAEVPANVALAARCAVTAERVGGILGELIAAAGRLALTIGELAARAASISTRIGGLLSARVRTALAVVVDRLPGSAAAAERAAAEQAAAERAALEEATTAERAAAAERAATERAAAERTAAADRAQYDAYVEKQKAAGKNPKSFDGWRNLRDSAARNRAAGEAYEKEWMEKEGVEPGRDGWDGQVHRHVTGGTDRVYDYANTAEKVGVEVKSGSSPVKDTLVQMGKDEDALRDGWDITWHLARDLDPALMARLRELAARYPNFHFDVGGG